MRRGRRAILTMAGALLCVALGAHEARAQTCQQIPAPTVAVSHGVLGSFPSDLADQLAVVFWAGVFGPNQGLSELDVLAFAAHLGIVATLQQVGIDTPEMAANFGSEFLFTIVFEQTSATVRKLTGSLVNTRTRQPVLPQFDLRLPDGDVATLNAIETLAREKAVGLQCAVINARLRPVDPKVTLEITPASPQVLTPGQPVTARVTLTDKADGSPGSPQPNRSVTIESGPGNTLTRSLTGGPTDGSGQASVTLPTAGAAAGPWQVIASFRRDDGSLFHSDILHYTVPSPRGDFTVTSPDAAVRPQATEGVCARLQRNGTPVAGAVIDFSATAGAIAGAAVGITGQDGKACTQYVAPPVNSAVDVVATTSVPVASAPRDSEPALAVAHWVAPEASDEGTTILPFATDTELPSIVTPVANVELEATLTLVVDGQVTFDLNAHSTVAGGTTSVTADLSVGGASLSGVTVTFSLAGGGGLSATSAVTDSVGHAEVSYLAPATSTSVIVTARAVVDGQTYAQSVTITVSPVGGASFAIAAMSAQLDNAGNCRGDVLFSPFSADPDPPLPYSHNYSDCGGQINQTVKNIGDNAVEYDVDLDAVSEEFSNASAVVAATFASARTMQIDLNPDWATSAPDPHPGYYLRGAVFVYDTSFRPVYALGYDYTNRRFISFEGTVWGGGTPNLAAGSYFIALTVTSSNNAANSGRGRVVTVTFR